MEFPRGLPSGGWDRTSRCHELQVTRICPGPQLRTARDIGSAGAPYPQPRALPGWPRAYREVWDFVGSGLRPCPQAEADSRPCVELKYGWGCGELPRPPTWSPEPQAPWPLPCTAAPKGGTGVLCGVGASRVCTPNAWKARPDSGQEGACGVGKGEALLDFSVMASRGEEGDQVTVEGWRAGRGGDARTGATSRLPSTFRGTRRPAESHPRPARRLTCPFLPDPPLLPSARQALEAKVSV